MLRRHPDSGSWALAQMWQAFHDHPGRAGNGLRRRILLESRDRPWSEAERAAHGLLRQCGAGGWLTNHRILLDGHVYYLDIAFPELRLCIEINGYDRHSRREVFEEDHWRRNRLNLAGWLVLEFTWRMLTDHPGSFIQTVGSAMAMR